MCGLLKMNVACMLSVVWQHTVVFNVETVLNDWKNQNCKLQSSLAFQILVGLFLNFGKIEPTVSYKLFLINKNMCNGSGPLMAQPPHPLGRLQYLSTDLSLLRASPPPLYIGLLCVLGLSQNLHQLFSQIN